VWSHIPTSLFIFVAYSSVTSRVNFTFAIDLVAYYEVSVQHEDVCQFTKRVA
jgi:hypothetical protein